MDDPAVGLADPETHLGVPLEQDDVEVVAREGTGERDPDDAAADHVDVPDAVPNHPWSSGLRSSPRRGGRRRGSGLRPRTGPGGTLPLLVVARPFRAFRQATTAQVPGVQRSRDLVVSAINCSTVELLRSLWASNEVCPPSTARRFASA
jgi:hypothetical protein